MHDFTQDAVSMEQSKNDFDIVIEKKYEAVKSLYDSQTVWTKLTAGVTFLDAYTRFPAVAALL